MKPQTAHPKKQRRQKRAGRTQVLAAANAHIVRRYPVGCIGHVPYRLPLPPRWIVPIALTSPGYGVVGEVGVVELDHEARILAGTPLSDVRAAVRRLREEKGDALHAAFLQAREA